MRVLITGFEPFSGRSHNTSWQLAEAVADELTHCDARTLQLPVSFSKSWQPLKRSIEQWQPDTVVALGESAKQSILALEMFAINATDGRIPDNDGYRPCNQIISPSGPVGYRTTLPVEKMLKAAEAQKVESSISFFAGTYVCNYIFYKLQEFASEFGSCSGFIHVPALENSHDPQLSYLKKGLVCMIGALHHD